ncbi:MAG: hypothetical protein US40_C0009G0001, partial [Candidatus Roizmanbacteria bacterium GW2011_GWC2_37_13]
STADFLSLLVKPKKIGEIFWEERKLIINKTNKIKRYQENGFFE